MGMFGTKTKNVLVISTFAIITFIFMPSKSSVSLWIKLQTKMEPSTLSQRAISHKQTFERIDNVSSIPRNKEKGISHALKRILFCRPGSHPVQGIQLTSGDSDNSWKNDIVVEGKLNASRNYAVFSATTENSTSMDYVFYLPLTTLAWKRIGFSSIILVAGFSNKSFSDPLIRYVLSRCLEHDAVVIHIFSPIENIVTISQVGRIFTANILSAAFPDIDLVYMVTSDADLWPIDSDIYRLRPDMAVLSLNSECCGLFPHRGKQIKMRPMSNIGMRVMTWNKITKHDSNRQTSSQKILNLLYGEFGQVALQPASKGENKGWYLDQMMISIMVKNWTDQYGDSHVTFVSRKTGNDRIDRSNWKGDSSLNGKVDAHMPLKAFSPNIWKKITPLLNSMYGHNSERYNWSIEYFEGFRKRNRN